MHKKQILVFDTFARTGGGLSYLKNIAHTLANRKSNFQYVFLCNPAIKEEITSLHSGATVIFGPKIISRGGILGFLLRRKLLSEAIKSVKPDLVLCMNQCDIKMQIPSVLFLRNPLYFSLKESYLRGVFSLKQKIQNEFWRWQSIRSIANTSRIITSTHAFSEMIVKDLGTLNKPVSVIPFGLNSLTQSASPRDYSKTTNLLCLQYNFYKGIESLIKSISILINNGKSIQLTITDDLEHHYLPEGRKAWELIGELSLHDNIKCIGKVPHQNLPKLYADSDIFVFPSLLESFGHGLLEAMGNAMPCVSSDISTSVELGGDCVVYHKTNDPVDCADKIMRVMSDESLRRDLGARGQIRARTFSWEKHVDGLEALFEEVT